MFIYNITLKAGWEIHHAWLIWMQNVHIAHIMSSGCFDNYQLVRLREVDEEEGPTYALQLYAASKADYDRYIELFLPIAEEKSYEKWGNNVLSFSTLMEIIR